MTPTKTSIGDNLIRVIVGLTGLLGICYLASIPVVSQLQKNAKTYEETTHNLIDKAILPSPNQTTPKKFTTTDDNSKIQLGDTTSPNPAPTVPVTTPPLNTYIAPPITTPPPAVTTPPLDSTYIAPPITTPPPAVTTPPLDSTYIAPPITTPPPVVTTPLPGSTTLPNSYPTPPVGTAPASATMNSPGMGFTTPPSTTTNGSMSPLY